MDTIVNHPRIKPISRRVVALGALIILLDGFDVQAIGFAATAISADLGIRTEQLGIVFSAGLVGALLGAFALSPLADRFGRRPIIELTVAMFGLFTLLTVFARSIEALCALRFLAGIGLGGAIPNVISHCIEYMPARRRGFVVGLLYAGFPIGGMLGAGFAALVMPMLGWKSLFVVGGLLPLLVIPAFHALAPESLQFLANAPKRSGQFKALLKRLAPDLEGTLQTSPGGAGRPKSPIADVFRAGGVLGSVLLWIPFFMVMVLLIVMVLWTPTLLQQSGLSITHSVLIVGLINLGSALGNVIAGRLIDRLGQFVVVPACIVAGTACLAPMGLLDHTPWLLSACAVGSGFFIGAAASGMMSLAAAWYPVHVRATGFGWAYSMGRLGQFVGPLIPGLMIGAGLGVTAIFGAMALPAAAALIAILMLRGLPHAVQVERERRSGLSLPQAH